MLLGWLAHQSAPVRRLQVGEAVRVLALQEWARPPPAVQLGTSGNGNNGNQDLVWRAQIARAGNERAHRNCR